VDAVEPQIRELLAVYPQMPATVIAERIGWTRSIRVLSSRVAELQPVYLPPDPASRTSYVAGEIAQCDLWFPPITLPVGFGQVRKPTQLPVLTMVCAYSRWLLALLLPSRWAEDLFAGWWRLIERLGAVPRVLVWDGEGAIGRWRGGRSELTTECQAFRGTLGAKVIVCPARPTRKRRGSSNGHLTGWNARSCPAARSSRRRIQIQADHIADLVLETRILRDLERALPPRPQAVLPPQPRHPGLRHIDTLGLLDVPRHLRRGPLRDPQGRRRTRPGQRENLRAYPIRDLTWPPG